MRSRHDDLKALHDALLGSHPLPQVPAGAPGSGHEAWEGFRTASSFMPPPGSQVPSLLETFERSRFTFAASWEWDPFVDVVRAADIQDAMSWFKRRFLAESGGSVWEPSDEEDEMEDDDREELMNAVLEDLRVYAVVREGTRVDGNLFTPEDSSAPFTDLEKDKGLIDPRAIPLKPGDVVHIVWQAEESLMVLMGWPSFSPSTKARPGATLHDVLARAWAGLSDRSASQTGADLLQVAREAGHDRKAYLHPDLIMIGGEVVLHGSL